MCVCRDNGVDGLQDLCGDHIRVLFGSFKWTPPITSCEGLIMGGKARYCNF